LLRKVFPLGPEEKFQAHYGCKDVRFQKGLCQTANAIWAEPDFRELRLFILSLNSLSLSFKI
jgi:hypothetical protein